MQIYVEAETLEKAREKLNAQKPEGLYLHILSTTDWKTVSGMVTAATMEEAYSKTPQGMPKTATVVKRHVLCEPRMVRVTLEAADQASLARMARTKASELSSQYNSQAEVKGMKLVKPSSKGLLGLGKHLDRYDVEIFIPANVKVYYRTMASISAEFGEKSQEELERIQQEVTMEHWVEALKKLRVEPETHVLPEHIYNDPYSLAKELGEKAPFVCEDYISWTTRESKTEYTYKIFRIDESTWGVDYDYEFLD